MNTRVALGQSALRSLGITALTSLLSAIPRFAGAGDNPSCYASFGEFPSEGDIDVPLNPIFFSQDFSYVQDGAGDIASFLLRRADGSGGSIPASEFVTLEEYPICLFVAYKPDIELEPQTAYVIEWDYHEVEFTTGAASDQDPPVLETDPHDPCEITYSAEERLVLMVSYGPNNMNLTEPEGGSVPGCGSPRTVYDAAGNSVEVGGNDAPDGGCDASAAGSPSRHGGGLLRALL